MNPENQAKEEQHIQEHVQEHIQEQYSAESHTGRQHFGTGYLHWSGSPGLAQKAKGGVRCLVGPSFPSSTSSTSLSYSINPEPCVLHVTRTISTMNLDQN